MKHCSFGVSLRPNSSLYDLNTSTLLEYEWTHTPLTRRLPVHNHISIRNSDLEFWQSPIMNLFPPGCCFLMNNKKPMSDLRFQKFSRLVLKILEFQLLYCLLSILSSCFHVSQFSLWHTDSNCLHIICWKDSPCCTHCKCTLLNTDVCESFLHCVSQGPSCLPLWHQIILRKEDPQVYRPDVTPPIQFFRIVCLSISFVLISFKNNYQTWRNKQFLLGLYRIYRSIWREMTS